MTAPFPFSAIVGQSEMKAALLMAAVEPRLGGVMVFGDRGTGTCCVVLPARARQSSGHGTGSFGAQP